MKRLLTVISTVAAILISVLYVICSLSVYFSPEHFPFLTIASILYLPVLVAYILLVIFWLFFRRKIGLLLLLLFFTGYKSFLSTVALNIFKPSWKEEKAGGSVRMMSWNVNFFGSTFKKDDSTTGIRRQMLDYIHQVNPDILCIQDLRFNEKVGSNNPFVNNINDILAAGGFDGYIYPFHYDYDGTNYCDQAGVAIFYRGEVIDTGSFLNNGHNKEERSGFIDFRLNNKPVRIFSAHFSSMSLWPATKEEAGLKYLEGDSTKQKAGTIYSKVREFGAHHAKEARVIRSFIDQSPYPVIVSADMNSVPSSYVYDHLKQGLYDAFLEKDIGIGGTYNRIFPKLRIDVLLHSKELQVLQFRRPAIDLSDHYPLIADIKWKE
jgi:endonuclease/exonuclease/phosphatase family metal-dependent hydrolase